jgi:hypothetical protein
MRRQYASELNVTTRVTTIDVTAIIPIKTQKRKSFADFFQYFFLLTYIFDAINPLLANDHLCPGGFHLIATYCRRVFSACRIFKSPILSIPILTFRLLAS